ncbi:DNA repair protein RecO [Algiphilus sp.]|uniref:DNA repair protein RecO n=1 Tax=Algiphilus sp. TaxID=1872431 RepID=UPI0025BE6225|nr:DNA repair protein RecO [Algiphilus sp.]MCK5769770.1 DNA repair protein RecO [Algiphilus sp.]
MSGAERVADEAVFVLLRRAYRDSSLLLEVLAHDHGRVGVVARGARGSKRGSAPALLQRYRLSWQRRGELATMTGAEVDGKPYALGGERTLWAWYANELLIRALARDDPHPGLFAAYQSLLAALAGTGDEALYAGALRAFEWQLLCELGYRPSLPDRGLDAAARFEYDPASGPRPEPDGTLTGAGLTAALSGRFDSADARGAARVVFRAHLPELIGPRPLQTPAMLRRLRAVRETAP